MDLGLLNMPPDRSTVLCALIALVVLDAIAAGMSVYSFILGTINKDIYIIFLAVILSIFAIVIGFVCAFMAKRMYDNY